MKLPRLEDYTVCSNANLTFPYKAERFSLRLEDIGESYESYYRDNRAKFGDRVIETIMTYPPADPNLMAQDVLQKIKSYISEQKKNNSLSLGGYQTPSSVQDFQTRNKRIEEEEKQLNEQAKDLIESYKILYPKMKAEFEEKILSQKQFIQERNYLRNRNWLDM